MALNEKMKFPREFDKDAKSLVKHLCAHDISTRYGNMVAGVNDIKNHRFFKKFDFDLLLRQSLQAPHVPQMAPLDRKKEDEVFEGNKSLPEYSDNKTYPPIKEDKDKFLSWFWLS